MFKNMLRNEQKNQDNPQNSNAVFFALADLFFLVFYYIQYIVLSQTNAVNSFQLLVVLK